MQSLRIQRVRELLKRAVGEVLRREISIDEAGLISVNDVGVSSDLRSATVFLGIVGKPSQKKRGAEILEQETKRLQTLVGHEVVLKYTPRLRFVVDDSIERGNRVLEIMEEIEQHSPKPTE